MKGQIRMKYDNLARALSEFAQLQKKTAVTIKEAFDGIMFNQRKLVSVVSDLKNSFNNICNIIRDLSKNARTEEERKKFAQTLEETDKFNSKIASILERLNNNNIFWILVICSIVSLISIAAYSILKEDYIIPPEDDDFDQTLDI